MKINTDRIEKMRRQKQMIALEQLLEEVKFYQRDKEDKDSYIKELHDDIIYHKEELQEAQLATSQLQEQLDNMKEKYNEKEKQVMDLVMMNYKLQNEKLELYKKISELQKVKEALEKILGIEL